ncbi:hypothetical protein Pmani_025531 [Petrolisthes manimaculis]|uniref:Uncharacterized protein n=1 Tax=Petrolisthes manimaculis TaxID=1843537 RepID=A0AAE1P7R9_9EUCA|nr:hypothetical protein Pmani_025531 [Petrolisthes manimaculis]
MQSTAKKEVAKAKDRAYEKLYEKLDSREGEKDLYRLARQRDRAGRDVQHVKMIKDVDGNILTSEESVLRRWKEYFEQLMNIENVRERRLEEWNEEVQEISRDEVRKAMKMKADDEGGEEEEDSHCINHVNYYYLLLLIVFLLHNKVVIIVTNTVTTIPTTQSTAVFCSCTSVTQIYQHEEEGVTDG